MCGIFAYLNHGVVRKRSDLMAMLIGGLKRLEYRGYDSAGIAIDGDKNTPGFVYKIVYLIFFLFIFLKKFINWLFLFEILQRNWTNISKVFTKLTARVYLLNPHSEINIDTIKYLDIYFYMYI